MFGAVYYQVIDLADFAHRNVLTKEGTEVTTFHVRNAISSLLQRKRRLGGMFVFATESPGQEERVALHPGYKATRRNRDPEAGLAAIRTKVADIMAVARCTKSLFIECPGFEGDDAVAGFVRSVTDRTIVYSADSDLWSLLQYPHVDIYAGSTPVTQERVDKKFVRNIDPSNIQLFKAVFGDDSDDIPRVPKLRVAVLADFFSQPGRTVADLFTFSDTIANVRDRQALQAHRDQITRMYEVVRLRDNVTLVRQEMPGDPDTLRVICRRFHCDDIVAQALDLTS